MLSCTRYYSVAGNTVGSRTASGLTWLAGDHHGTTQVSITASTLAVTSRRSMPFGEARGTPPTWPNDKGFVGGTTDPTGLTHLGAREYDPNTGRFISVDPRLNAKDPQQWHGYSYANNSRTSLSDPSGLEPGSWCDDSACAVLNAQAQTSHPMETGSVGGVVRKKAAPAIKQSVCDAAYVTHYGTCPAPYTASGCLTQQTDIKEFSFQLGLDPDDYAELAFDGGIGSGAAFNVIRQRANDLRRSGNPANRAAGEGLRAWTRSEKVAWLRWLGDIARSPAAEVAGKLLLIGGFALDVYGNLEDGDDGTTAFLKAGIETGLAVVVGGAAAGLGGFCGPAAVACGIAFGAVGGFVGAQAGKNLNNFIDSVGGWDAVDSWFSWD